MGKVFIHLADGFEEIEAIAPYDILIRGGCNVITVSVMGRKEVKSSRGIRVIADELFEDINYKEGDIIILPGGMPGSKHLDEHKGLHKVILEYYNEGKLIAAICAAPMVFGHLGVLKGKSATCYPGMENELYGANTLNQSVVVDGNVITSKGAGTAAEFAFKILEILKGSKVVQDVKNKMIFK